MSGVRCPRWTFGLSVARRRSRPPLAAQGWDSPEALALVRRAVDQRAAVEADSTLRSYRTRAHGFVFFLAQVGEGLTEPPRLVKADELDVEVYWQAPNRSKQVVLGWRDGAFLPTDIEYHRDHLGIVTNNFGDLIRIGEGDEVRDAIHPLSRAGPAAYQYALGDSLAIATGGGEITVREVQVRPRSFARPLVVGTLYLDAATAELVRFRFSFTPAAYLDRQLEDITIVLENGRFESRWWLPHPPGDRDPAAGQLLRLPRAGHHPRPVGDRRLRPERPDPARGAGGARHRRAHGARAPTIRPGTTPLSQAIADVARAGQPAGHGRAAGRGRADRRVARARRSSRQPSRHRLAERRRTGESGSGSRTRVSAVCSACVGSRIQLRPQIGYGTSDERLTGGLGVLVGSGATQLSLAAERRVRDLSDLPVISPALNSLLSQEAGDDYGDYVLLNAAAAAAPPPAERAHVGLAGSWGWRRAGRWRSARHRPPAGTGRIPPLGAGTYRVARVASSGPAAASRCGTTSRGGSRLSRAAKGPGEYLRVSGGGPLARARPVRGSSSPGCTSAPAPTGCPRYRSFVLGGRGTLLGEPFRAYGGRTVALAHMEWRFEVPFPAVPLGSFASTGRHLTVAPFVARRVDRAADRRHALGRHRRGASGGGRGDRVAHAPHPARSRGGPARRAFRGERGREPGLVGHPVMAAPSGSPGYLSIFRHLTPSRRMQFVDEWLVPSVEPLLPGDTLAALRQEPARRPRVPVGDGGPAEAGG